MMRILSLLKSSTALVGDATASPSSSVSSGTPPIFAFVDDSVSWVMTDYDATAHITEEMKNPAIKAPISILAALGSTYVLGFCLNIALSITMGTAWPDLLASPTGLPVAQIMYNVLGRRGGVAFIVLAAAICNFTGASCLQAQARTCFALSRGIVLLILWARFGWRERRDEMMIFGKSVTRLIARSNVAVFEAHGKNLAQDKNSSYCSLG